MIKFLLLFMKIFFYTKYNRIILFVVGKESREFIQISSCLPEPKLSTQK